MTPPSRYEIEIHSHKRWWGKETFWWRIVAGNGEVILQSTAEKDRTKASCARTARAFAEATGLPVVDVSKEGG